MNELAVREYLGNKIEFKTIEGYVYANANQMANGFGGSDKLKNWKNSPNTKRYIEALEKSLGKNYPTELILVNQGGKAKEQGTWIHEKLILNFARYLNVEFELWCDEQIATLLREGKVELQPKPMSIQQMMIITLQEQEKLANRVDSIEDKVDNEIRVDNGEQRKIQKAVGTRIYQRMDIINNHQNKKYMFQSLYRDLKDRFGVASYRDIKRKDLGDTLEYISTWIEPSELRVKVTI